jgi:hypothetical protein
VSVLLSSFAPVTGGPHPSCDHWRYSNNSARSGFDTIRAVEECVYNGRKCHDGPTDATPSPSTIPAMNAFSYITILLGAVGIALANPLEQRCVRTGGQCQSINDCCAASCVDGVSLHNLSSHVVQTNISHFSGASDTECNRSGSSRQTENGEELAGEGCTVDFHDFIPAIRSCALH